MRETLPPYDPAAKCPKCGSDDIGTSYVGRSDDEHAIWRNASPCGLRGSETPEHLDRRCRRCRFGWPEATREENR